MSLIIPVQYSHRLSSLLVRESRLRKFESSRGGDSLLSDSTKDNDTGV